MSAITFDLDIQIDYDYKKVLSRSLDRCRLRSVISVSSDFTTALTITTSYFCNWTSSPLNDIELKTYSSKTFTEVLSV